MRSEPEPDHLVSLDPKSRAEWSELASRARVAARRDSDARAIHDDLAAAAGREPQSPAAPAYRLWLGDHLARQQRYADAVAVYDHTISAAEAAPRLAPSLDFATTALSNRAAVAFLSGDVAGAVAAYEALGRQATERTAALFRAGVLVESSGDFQRAADFYRSIAAAAPSARTDNPADLARRALERLQDTTTVYSPDPFALADRLADALSGRAFDDCERLVSRTHFAIGPVGGHTGFETRALLDTLLRELAESDVQRRPGLLGSGGKLYLLTSGWRGKWFHGDVAFIVTKAPQGWQWTGVGVTEANERWNEHWRPPVLKTNQPLPFELLAPWPADVNFMAGGMALYAAQQLAVLAAGWFWFIPAAAFATSRCGFGPRGYYYNTWPTHDEEDAFAIDFTRYRQFVPYDNESGGTPVLAARAGLVVRADYGTTSGFEPSNTVEIEHADPANPTNTNRFRSRYLHLAGPAKLSVSVGMPVIAGNRLGLMDDTGNSILDHLHFSIHDRSLPHPNSPYGASVRPTPMSGVHLGDDDSGACVRSTNIEYERDRPMRQITTFAVQNWIITPLALAVNEAPPARIQDQRWQLILSGVAIVDLKGVSASQWLRETVSIVPQLGGPLNYAVGRYGIPQPPGTDGLNYWTGFQVEQWVPHAAVSALFNQQESINSGFAVDAWRLNPFMSGQDAFSSGTHTNLFAGLQVDLAVRDSDAWIYRVSYHITLTGKIVFGPIVIT